MRTVPAKRLALRGSWQRFPHLITSNFLGVFTFQSFVPIPRPRRDIQQKCKKLLFNSLVGNNRCICTSVCQNGPSFWLHFDQYVTTFANPLCFYICCSIGLVVVRASANAPKSLREWKFVCGWIRHDPWSLWGAHIKFEIRGAEKPANWNAMNEKNEINKMNGFEK